MRQSSKISTVTGYLASLPAERRAVVSRVRRLVRRHLPRGYRETFNWGMITYEVPFSRFPKESTYNKQPLCYAGLAAQKNHFTLYLMGAYANPSQYRLLKGAFRKAGKRFDMGKSCLRFRKIEDLELDAVGRVIASTPVDELIEKYQAARRK